MNWDHVFLWRVKLALPIYPELNEDQQHYVVQTVREGLAQ